MREYAVVRCAYWASPVTQSLSDDGKLLSLYLLTSANTSPLGCFRLPDGYLIGDLGWTPDRIERTFDELDAQGFCRRCRKTQFVLIHEFLSWNPIPNPNSARAREREFQSVPRESEVFSDLCRALQRYGNHWSRRFETVLEDHTGTPSETVSEDITEPRQTKSKQIIDDAYASLSLRRDEEEDDETSGKESTPGDQQPTGSAAEESSDTPESTGRINPLCPTQKIVERYNRICSSLPPAKLDAWSEAHRKQLRARWRWLMGQPIRGDERGRKYAEDPEAALDWFERLFTHIQTRCPHLIGHNNRGWTASLIWIIGPQNFTKIVEGNYDRTEVRGQA